MIYGLKIAWRYLSASRGQTALLVSGVAVGVFVFVFMSALIGGLGSYLVLRTVGDISHVTLTAPSAEAGLLGQPLGQTLVVQQKALGQREIIRNFEAFLPMVEEMPAVKAVSPQVLGNGFVLRGQSRAAVAVIGLEADRVSAITDFASRMVAGDTRLSSDNIMIGQRLAEDLGVTLGQTLEVQSDRGVSRRLTISGIFEIGLESLDARTIYLGLNAARGLFEMPQGFSRIDIKLDDLYQAEAVAAVLAQRTGLKSSPWTDSNAQLLQGLTAQQSSGDLIKGFALITIVIGVASALLLSTYRRRPEIGIMRAFGASKAFVVGIFVLQGALIGVLGGLVGAGLGYLMLSQFPPPKAGEVSGFPIDYTQGAYGLAIALTTLGAILASILPARAAAAVDPVKVIGQ